MYLSRIKLDPSLRLTMRALAAPNLMHGAIEKAETGERTRKLWRVDQLHGAQYLLILSPQPTDFSSVAEQFGGTGDYVCKSYDGLLDRITNGSSWQFRLRANPTVQQYVPEKGRGKVLAHITPRHQENWLLKQAEKNGFSLSEGEWLVTGSKWYIFKKNRNQPDQVKLLSVTYEGTLTVTDAEAFRKALVNGIGREKAFGQGLLTVAGRA